MSPYDKSLLTQALAYITNVSSSPEEKSCAEKLVFAYDVAHTVPQAARKALFESGVLMTHVRPEVFLSLSPLRSVVIRRVTVGSANDLVKMT